MKEYFDENQKLVKQSFFLGKFYNNKLINGFNFKIVERFKNCSNLKIYKDDLNIFISKVNNYFKKLKYVNKFMQVID